MYGEQPEFAMTEKVCCVFDISKLYLPDVTLLLCVKELAKFIGFNNKLNKYKQKPPPQKKK